MHSSLEKPFFTSKTILKTNLDLKCVILGQEAVEKSKILNFFGQFIKAGKSVTKTKKKRKFFVNDSMTPKFNSDVGEYIV